jgi:hypothetical protein
MEELARIIDTDAKSLDARIDETLERFGFDCLVQRFTHWYTGRAPVHEARVLHAVAA